MSNAVQFLTQALQASAMEKSSFAPRSYVYLSSGDLNGYYTLRVVTYSVEYDQLGVAVGYQSHDRYVQNLSIEGGNAERKAAEYAEAHGFENHAVADFDLCGFSRWEFENTTNIGVALELQRFLFGKHAGCTFEQVIESDLQYMQWILDEGRVYDDNDYIKGSRMSDFRCAAVAIYRLQQEGKLNIPAPEAIKWEPEVPSEYIGEIGDKVDLEGVVEFTKVIDTLYGFTELFVIKVADRDIVKFFTSSQTFGNVGRGDRIKFKGTVDKHDDQYNGARETFLKRPKCVEILEDEDGAA
jgi:hypothetical protein